MYTQSDEFQQIMDQLRDGVFVSKNGKFEFVNQSLVTQLGYASAPDLLGHDIAQFVAVSERNLWSECSARLNSESTGFRTEIHFLQKNTQCACMEIDYLGQTSSGGLIFSTRDVTAQKQLQGRLLLTDRMASVGTLAAGVAHEINNPLAYVISNVELVTTEFEKMASSDVVQWFDGLEPTSIARGIQRNVQYCFSELLQTLREAREGIERVRNITRDLKTFSRADQEERSFISLKHVIDASVNMAWNEIRHRAQLCRDYDNAPTIIANESRVGQVLLNLLLNAAQSIPEGFADVNKISIRAFEEGAFAIIEVCDTGCGIPKDVLNKIFDPFFSTKPVGVGTGLGLSICHGIIANLGGTISVESEIGKGSVFRVALPQNLSTVTRNVRHSEPVRVEKRGSILVIDDEPMIGVAIRRALQTEHNVIAVTSGHDAIEKLDAGEVFDVILCDLVMPVMTGAEFFEKVHDRFPWMVDRIVFLTGGAFTRDGFKFLEQVPNAHLEKPFDNKDLRKLIQERIRIE